MSGTTTSAALLNARYVAIRTAEAKGLTDRLLDAARDRTPGVRRLLTPILYRFWHRERELGWSLVGRIGDGVVRFPGLVDRDALEILVAVSMPILNASRHEPEQLARLAAIWRQQMTGLFGSPLARTARVVGRNWVLRAAANSFATMMKKQPVYQPVNYQELEVTFGRDAAFRAMWREALDCFEHPEAAPLALGRILGRADLPFDLYLMLCCERVLIKHGVSDPAWTLDFAERLFAEGCTWFRQSVMYALFHVLSAAPEVEDAWLDRYDAMAQAFFVSGSWRLETSAGRYAMPGHVANADVVRARHRPDQAPRVVPALLRHAIASGEDAQVAAMFAAIDGVAFYHGNGALALMLIERAHELGGKAVERHVATCLANVRLLDQPLVDAFLDQHRFEGIDAAHVAAAEPSITEDDLLTQIDGFIIQSMLTTPGFHAQLCGAFRRALDAQSPQELMAQLLVWVRDELARVGRR